MKKQLLSCSRKLSRHRALAAFMQAIITYCPVNTAVPPQGAIAVLAWGRKPSAVKAAKLAQKLELPLWQLEDGFIHSLGQGVLGAASCSLVVDKRGIYYDATQVSDLEKLLADDPQRQLSDNRLLSRAEYLIQRITAHYVTKYNNAPLTVDHLQLPAGKKVLLVDQTQGDLSLKYGLVAFDAEHILQTVLTEQPDATILLKSHPDVIAGKKKGFFAPLPEHPRIQVVTEPVNPLALLAQVEQVYVLTSQLGFEALLMAKPVTCFGVPFYAGWGVTDDRADQAHAVFARRKRQRSVTELFAAAYLLYSRYVHPDRLTCCQAEEVVDYFSEQHRLFNENRGHLFAFGFSRWKRNYIRRFLYAPGNTILFTNTAKAAQRQGFDAHSHIVAWGERAVAEAHQLAETYKTPIWRVEDGFIRSAGLGSDYTPPLSLVLDKRGIYYDPTRPSDLEHLLQTHDFPDDLLGRAHKLRKLLLKYELSKYNLGELLVSSVIRAEQGQRVLLVPGQVEDDASIRKGCPYINNNTGLLQAVRNENPDAYIIYKPHPDVVSGNRRGKVKPAVLRVCCNLVLEDHSVTQCLEQADEVHTMTSLVGFEGLLREKKVVCYGLPFYAGWGLTTDQHTIERRTRRLSLNQLVAATLVLYPRYINWATGTLTTPEQAIEILRQQLSGQGGKKKNKVNTLKRLKDKCVHICYGVFTFRY